MSILHSVRSSLFGATLLTALSASIVVPHPVRGQSQSINGTIRGSVTDTTGAPIPAASVTVKDLDTGFSRQVATDNQGLYVAPNLPTGSYSVTAEGQGFAPLTQSGIRLSAGSDLVIDEQLKAGSVATQVDVTSDAPIIEPAKFVLGRTITAVETQSLPLTSRNPYNFVLFQPGVSGHPNPENGIPRTVNTNGLVDRINYQLDGMVDTETDRYGLRLFAISDSYADDVQVISNSPPAEFGNTAGVTFNVTTPRGTNAYHGSVQYIWRPKVASACPILQNCIAGTGGYAPKPDLHVDDYVGRIGGPIKRDKLFFFGAYEKLKRANPMAVTITPANQQTLIGYGIDPSIFLPAPSVQRAQWVNVRGDWNINTKNQAFVRYNYFRNNYPFNTNVGGLYALDAASDFLDRAHILGAQLITTFTPNLINEFRGSWPYRNQHHIAGPQTGAGPMITISGIANFGGTNGAGDKFQEKIPSFSDNVTLIRGPHSFKFGVGFQKNLDTQLADIYTQYTFASIDNWHAAVVGANGGPSAPNAGINYSTVKSSIGLPGAAYHSIFFDLFAQDTWQFRKNILLSYGVRYDQYRAPTPPAGQPFLYTQKFRTPLGNFAPRFGISYQPHDTTVIRLNAALIYEATPTNSWYQPLYNNGAVGSGSFIATVAGNSSCSPQFPNTPQQVPVSCLPRQDIYALTPNFKNGYVWNANLQVQQQLSKGDSLTLGYVMTSGRNMQFLRNMNLTGSTQSLADGRPIFGAAGPATRVYNELPNGVLLNNITLIDIGSNSSYNAMTVSYEHRMTGGLTVSGNYSWSHSINDTPEGNTYEFSTPIEDPTNPKRDRGNSSINRPNSFTGSVVYAPTVHFDNRIATALANGNNLAVLANLSTGDQQSITVSQALNGDSTATSRPLFVGRNTLRTPNIYQYDLRYTRSFGTYLERIEPQLLVEANNVFNHSNVTTINTTATVSTNVAQGPVGAILTPPTLAPTSSVLEARILQFGLRVQF